MQNTKPQEVQGRLLLWHLALFDTRQQISLALRADAATTDKKLTAEIDAFHQKVIAFKKTLPSTIDARVARDLELAFTLSISRPFPTLEECYQFSDSCKALALVYFCQLFNRGDAASDMAVANTKAIRDEYFLPILEAAFPAPETRQRVEAFLEVAITNRNSMIAHADAKAFNIRHGSEHTTMNLRYLAWKDLDLDLWAQTVDALLIATLTHLQLVKDASK